MENTTSFRPVSFHSCNFKVSVSWHEQKVVINKLLSNLFIHSCQWIISTSQISSKILDSILHQILNAKTLFLCNARRKTKSINRSTNANPGGMNRHITGNIAFYLGSIHVWWMFCIRLYSMVFLNNGVEHISKILVRVPVTSINSTVLIVKLYCTSNCLG